MAGSALFLDRDGVINVDHGYVHRSDQFEFIPGIFDLARFAVNELRWRIVVITNQSGIGRGYYDEAAYQQLTRWMCERFEAENAKITRVYHCPYHPEHGIGEYRLDHPWRKPKPGMIMQAASDLDIDLARSAIIGDTLADIAAGAEAGYRPAHPRGIGRCRRGRAPARRGGQSCRRAGAAAFPPRPGLAASAISGAAARPLIFASGGVALNAWFALYADPEHGLIGAGARQRAARRRNMTNVAARTDQSVE